MIAQQAAEVEAIAKAAQLAADQAASAIVNASTAALTIAAVGLLKSAIDQLVADGMLTRSVADAIAESIARRAKDIASDTRLPSQSLFTSATVVA